MKAVEVGFLVEKISGDCRIVLDKIKLQKLTYITFGFYGAITEEKYLFNDRIEAWKLGPVIPNLYYNPTEKPEEEVSEKVLLVVRQVVTSYGKSYSSNLIDLTHRPGTPWSMSYQEGKNNEIDKDLIIHHYGLFIKAFRFVSDSGLWKKLAKS